MEHLALIQQATLAWFERYGRDLPWRLTRDPYAVLVSEVMLQQTQVDRVVPRYLRFLDRFPGPDDLAMATPADVLREWSGLGYNSRGLRLWQAARAIVERHGGRFPCTEPGLRALPGVGPYTAAAVLCFAFGRPVPLLDTNHRRVLGRLFFGPVDRGTSAGAFERLARAALPGGRAYEWNQALMDLGATVCTARPPSCGSCPVQRWCRSAGGARLGETPASYVVSRQGPFAGSTRWLRGRVIAELAARGAMSPPALAATIGAPVERIVPAVEALERDGLVEQTAMGVRLPGDWRAPAKTEQWG